MRLLRRQPFIGWTHCPLLLYALTVTGHLQHGHHLRSFLCVQPHRPVSGDCHWTAALYVFQRVVVQVNQRRLTTLALPLSWYSGGGVTSLYAVCSSGYIAMFIHPYTWSFYTASVLVGIAAAGKATLSSDCLFFSP